jgi:hypothetical protein
VILVEVHHPCAGGDPPAARWNLLELFRYLFSLTLLFWTLLLDLFVIPAFHGPNLAPMLRRNRCASGRQFWGPVNSPSRVGDALVLSI